MEDLKRTWSRRRTRGCVIALVLIVYALLATVFSLYIQVLRGWRLYLVPYAALHLFLQSWFDPSILILVLAVAPLIGWFLRCMNIKPGKYVIIFSESILLAMSIVVTILHVILGFAGKDQNYVALSFLLAPAGIVIPCCVLWAVHLWDPK